MPNFTGTDGNDTFTGTADNEIINGGAGNDILSGGDGNDEIDGGSGQDQSFGEGGDDTLIVSVAPVPGEIYNGGTGTDTLRALTGVGLANSSLSSIERIEYGSLSGSRLNVTLLNNQIGSGLSATAELVGGEGNDQLTIVAFQAGTYTVQAFTYTNWTHADEAFEIADTVVLIGTGNASYTLNASAGHLGVQTLIGGSGNDTLNGTDGLEVLNGGGGADTLNAGGGDDVLVAANATPFGGVPTFFNFAGSVYDGGAGFDWLSIAGYVNFQGLLSSIEGVNFQPAFTATVPGQASTGEAHLEINTGAYELAPDDLHLRGTGTLSIELDAGGDFDGSLWVHEAGSNVHVEVFGNEGSETFIGTTGNDRFSGGFGADTMTGGAGNDQFEAGEGQATVTDFTVGQDRVDLQDMNITSFAQLQPYLSQVGNDVVFSRMFGGVAQTMTLQNVDLGDLTAASFVFQTGDDDDTRDGTEFDDELIGGNGNDTLNGFGGNDILFGGGGDDSLDGGAGNDLLDGGDGNDFMAGGAGDDVYIVGSGDAIVENVGEGTDEIRTSIDWGLNSEIENLTATGTGNIFLGGNALANVLIGNNGNNYFVGEGGNDTINGDGGRDTAAFRLPSSTTGTLRMVEGEGGLLLVQLVQTGGAFETLFEVSVSGSGNATVTGVGSMSGVGTDTVSSVEELHFLVDTWPNPIPEGQIVVIRLSPSVPAVDGNNFAHVGGSVADDVIDLAVLYPGQAGTATLNADGGLGDDVISGTDLGNFIQGVSGNDTLNGRGGNDTLQGGAGDDLLDGGTQQDQAQFVLTANLSGTWSLVKNYGDGSFSVMLTRSGVQEEAFRLTNNTGTWTVVGMNSAAYLGTDTLTNVETVGFFFEGPFNNATSLFIQLSPIVAQNGTQLGGLLDDVMDFSALAGPVTANGGFGNDTITGTNANDFLNGQQDNDTLSGLGGNDIMNGGVGNDVLTGGDGADQLRGDAGNDQMFGGADNDLLRGGTGVDSFDGGTGGENATNGYGDRISFYDAAATQGVIADLRTGVIANDGFGNAETMTGIESLGADTAFADTFHGNDGINVLFGNRTDNLYGHGGEDSLSLTSAAAVVDGGDGTDVLFLNVSDGVLVPDANADGLAEILLAATAGWTVNLGTGAMTDGYGNVGSVTAIESISGSQLADSLTGDGGANTLTGGAGNDFINGGGGNDLIDGGDGDDVLRGAGGDDQLLGGAGNDNLRGGTGVDSYDGGTNDFLFNINTGYGDRISFYDLGATAAVVADLRTGTISNDGFGNVETMTDIESLGSDTAFADTFHGNDVTNALYGNRGDFLSAYGGADYFYTSSAAAVVDGGDGVDTLSLDTSGGWLRPDENSDGLAEQAAAATAGWAVNLTTGEVIDGYGNIGTVVGIENLEGSALADTLTGTDGANSLTGGAGDDLLRAGEGDDSLYGGDGNDTLAQTLAGNGYTSTYGNDLYDGGAGSDRVSLFTVFGPGVTVNLNLTTAQNTGAAGTDTFIGIEHITATYGHDTLTGNADANWFWTFAGNDTLAGNAGDDYFTVSFGTKIIDGGTGVDTVDVLDTAFEPVYTADGITVSLALQGQAQATGIGSWTLSNIENLGGNYGSDDFTGDGNANILAGHQGDDVLRGMGGDDILAGDGAFEFDGVASAWAFDANPDWVGGNDILEGGGGNDTLYGGGGDDVLRGGAGDDGLFGGTGHDLLTEGGAAGNDLYDGGSGSDRVSFFIDSFSGVTVDLRIAEAQNTGRGSDTFVGVEHITADYGSDTLIGNDATNWFWTFAGNDTLSGNGGDDYFTVGQGTKVVDGGSGNDVLEISDTAYVPMYTIENGVTISLELQGQAQATGIGNFTLTSIEDLSGDVGNDTFIGDANANRLAGYSGDDTLRGGGGDDRLAGDGTFELDAVTGELVLRDAPSWATAGADRLEGGAGNDVLIGGGGNDSLDGGTGLDQAIFTVPGNVGGAMSIVQVGAEQHVMLTIGDVQTLVAVIAITDGYLTVTGVGPAAALGTDQISGVETLVFASADSDVSFDIDVGVVADGLVAGATVFMDASGNGAWDDGEARTTTGSNGSYSFLTTGSGSIIAIGGTNTDTGLPNQVTLAAPEGSTIVNPITTLIQAVMDNSGGELTAEQAATQVASSLGLSSDLDLLNLDLFTAASGGNTDALDAQKAAVIIVGILVAADDASTDANVAANILNGLATLVIEAPEGGVSLSSEATITQVLASALPPEVVQAIAADVAASAQAIDEAESLDDVSTAQSAGLTTGNDLSNTLTGGAGDDVLQGRGGADTLTGGGGTDTFLDTAAGLNGDTITDLAIGDRIVISDASLSGFGYALTGNSLTFTGGSMTLQTAITGRIVVSAAAGGGVQLTAAPLANDVANDFNGDGHSDILWRNADGSTANWLGNQDGSYTPNFPSVINVDGYWHIAGTGDFNGDGRDDILWRGQGGETGNWLANTDGTHSYNAIGGIIGVPADWNIAGVGDFNGDGRDDILWRNDSGLTGNWLATATGGYTINDSGYIGVPNDWQIAGVADFNGDGNADILWRNDNGAFGNWLANDDGGFAINGGSIVQITSDWHLIGTGDFNGDGRDDILWRHDSGTTANWTANADGTFSPNFASLTTITSDWNVASVGDYNGDGRDDILWRHDSGTIANWLANADDSATFTTNDASFVGIPNDWQVQDPATLLL